MLICFLLCLLVLFKTYSLRVSRLRRRGRLSGVCRIVEKGAHRHGPRKPAWVRQELIRLHAWSPTLGCRTLALTFNRRHGPSGMTVGNTYVAKVLRQGAWEVARLRQQGKHRTPPPLPRNRIWALDLTGGTDLNRTQHMILGVLDHGTRACLTLQVLPDKRAVTILRVLLQLFRSYGLPRQLRVDNERCLNAAMIRTSLRLLGIRLTPIMLHCPWQNGRIERLFGSLKRELSHVAIRDGADLATKLMEFRAWYNHARPHQHLGGRTPAEMWRGRADRVNRLRWFNAWNGQLGGWYALPS